MKEQLTPHIKGLISRGSQATALQYVQRISAEQSYFSEDDPLLEESLYSPVRGLVHKFHNRVLWKVTYRCAAHCQFCTRLRQIGKADGDLSDQDIQRGLGYLMEHPEVDDVILSGGDPLYVPQHTLKILDGLARIPAIKVYRIGSRLPLQSPRSLITLPLKELLAKVRQLAVRRPIIFQLHIDHPDELTTSVKRAIRILKCTGAILVSQTVFLKGINDDVEVMTTLFTSIYYLGVIPYYIYRCDKVRGLESFVCPIEKEQEIMTQLRKRISGLAVPLYAVDVAGRGKIPIPLGFWSGVDLSKCSDFDGRVVSI